MFNKREKFFSTFLTILLLLFVFAKFVNAQVVINEFSVSPSDKNDWIELFSPTTVDISGWTIADESGEFRIVSSGTQLGPGIYYIVSQYQRLNNDKGTIIIYDASGKEIDSIKYGYEGEVCVPSAQGSIGRKPDGANLYDRFSLDSKGATNNDATLDPCPTPTPLPTNTSTPTPKPTNTSTPTPTPKPTHTPTPKPTIKSTSSKITDTNINQDKDAEEIVLGAQKEEKMNNQDEQVDVEGVKEGKFPYLSLLFIIVGAVFLGLAGYPFIKKYKSKNPKT